MAPTSAWSQRSSSHSPSHLHPLTLIVIVTISSSHPPPRSTRTLTHWCIQPAASGSGTTPGAPCLSSWRACILTSVLARARCENNCCEGVGTLMRVGLSLCVCVHMPVYARIYPQCCFYLLYKLRNVMYLSISIYIHTCIYRYKCTCTFVRKHYRPEYSSARDGQQTGVCCIRCSQAGFMAWCQRQRWACS